jgi:hypothetical protein
MIRFPDLAIVFLLTAAIRVSSRACLEPHVEKITVAVSTDKNQTGPALFFSPGPIEFSLEKHVNALKYEALLMVLTHRSS